MSKKIEINETFDLAEKYHKKNNFSEAKKLYEKIIKIEPNHLKTIFRLGSLLAQTNNFDKAKYFLGKVIEIEPSHSKAHNNLGIVFNRLREYTKAKQHYEQAIKIDSSHEEAHSNLGLAFYELREFEKSLKCYQKAIEINPNNLNTINNISILFRQINLDSFREIEKEKLRKLFLLLYKRTDIEHKDIFSNAKKILLNEENYNQLKNIIHSNSLLEKNFIKEFLEDELLLSILQKSLVADVFLEKLLTKIRSEILILIDNKNIKVLEEKYKFIISLAQQCFLNEYCFFRSREEIDLINKLKKKIETNNEINELEIAILGCYVPLIFSEKILFKLAKHESKNYFFKILINLHIKEPIKEKELIHSIKSFDIISDSVSDSVREQYEENPFPRWMYTYTPTKSNPLNIINYQIRPNNIQINDKFNKPNILIAGCGTGKQIFISQNYHNAKILAVDLSKKSLAYAKRKIEEQKINNVEFLHADILKLNNLNIKYDIIESIGVLHHMKDPLKGLEVLSNLMQPHGFMKLGLYSKIARKNLERARDLINKKNYKAKYEDIIKFRQEIMNNEKDNLLKKIPGRLDFYSISGIRDFLFNVQEHRFTLPELSKVLLSLDLEFLGFADLIVKNKYSKLYPSDKKNILLDNWHQFEVDNPETFTGMYNFWVKKIL